MKTEPGSAYRGQKVEDLHREIMQWKSHLNVMKEEMSFLDLLLTSAVFQRNTPNLFERLLEYKERLKKVRIIREIVQEHISMYEINLLEGLDAPSPGNLGYAANHPTLKAQLEHCLGDFQDLKLEIFNYTGGILSGAISKTS